MRDQVRLRGDEQRVARSLAPELRDQLAERNAQEDRDDREDKERERHDRGADEHAVPEQARRYGCFLFGRTKPAPERTPRPVGPSTLRTNALAAALFELAFTTAIS